MHPSNKPQEQARLADSPIQVESSQACFVDTTSPMVYLADILISENKTYTWLANKIYIIIYVEEHEKLSRKTSASH